MKPHNRSDEEHIQHMKCALPPNVRAASSSVITGDYITGDLVFKRFRSTRDPALVIGTRSVMDGVLFNLGKDGFIEIGDDCCFRDAYLICEGEIRVGHRVFIGWHATIVDCDFHPLDTSERIKDAIALSPVGEGVERPAILSRRVVIEDDVWIGPNATILKGVCIGAGAVVSPGAVVTRDVAPGSKVIGNPATEIGETRE
jgi:acetyltransferase-like isoleucine patch superfamily enzyme